MSRAIGVESCERVCASVHAGGDGVENIPDGGESGFDAGLFGMNAVGDKAANPGYQDE